MQRLLALAAAILLAGCAFPSDGRPSATLPADAPMLTVTSEGGFAPVEQLVGRGPRFVLMADGRLLFEEPAAAVDPAPMLTGYLVVQVDEATLRTIRRLVDEIGFPGFSELRNDDAADRVADATTEVVTYRDGDGDHVFAVYALGLVDPDDRRVELLRALLDLVEEAATSGEPEAAPVDHLVVHVAEVPADPELSDVRPWPLPEAPEELESIEPLGWRCATYDAATAAELVGVFTAATRATLWEEGDTTFRILARPLLPGEAGCAVGG
ncbi:MAG TPA: hypothetical protein ENK55_08575 [Actinobacteria bacterium]|nr:hypothetical protein [Actinomycetota bacterium]